MESFVPVTRMKLPGMHDWRSGLPFASVLFGGTSGFMHDPIVARTACAVHDLTHDTPKNLSNLA
jgi:hypothetical protein